MPELLNEINVNLLQERCGCAMHFYEVKLVNIKVRLNLVKTVWYLVMDS